MSSAISDLMDTSAHFMVRGRLGQQRHRSLDEHQRDFKRQPIGTNGHHRLRMSTTTARVVTVRRPYRLDSFATFLPRRTTETVATVFAASACRARRSGDA